MTPVHSIALALSFLARQDTTPTLRRKLYIDGVQYASDTPSTVSSVPCSFEAIFSAWSFPGTRRFARVLPVFCSVLSPRFS